jgi:hypothetical protein
MFQYQMPRQPSSLTIVTLLSAPGPLGPGGNHPWGHLFSSLCPERTWVLISSATTFLKWTVDQCNHGLAAAEPRLGTGFILSQSQMGNSREQ